MPDGTFVAKHIFQFDGVIHREGTVINISENDLAQEMAKGIHPRDGKPMSGLLCHGEPDDKTVLLMKKIQTVGAEKEIIVEDLAKDRRNEIYKEMEVMGLSFDRRWNNDKLEAELIKAKKLKGL